MNALWLVVLLPSAGALAALLTRGALATAIARATAVLTAILASLVALGGSLGAAVEQPWLPARGLRFALRLDPLAIAGILTVAWVTALAAAHGRGRKLGLLLVGEAAALIAWLADDLATMVAAWSLLAIVAAAMVGRSRQSIPALFLPLSAAAGALSVTAMLLGLGHHEATLGTWSLHLGGTLDVLAPVGQEIAIATSAVAAALLMAGVWPLHGWWRSAAEKSPPAFGAWLPAVLRPLGIGLLVRVMMPAAATTTAMMAPFIAGLGALQIVVGLAGAATDVGAGPGERRHLHLAHLPTGAALIGVATLSPEGIGGALLLGLAGGLAFALVHLVGRPERPLHRVLATVGLLGLLGLPGLLSFAGTLPIALASLGQGAWQLPGAAFLGLLLLAAPPLAFAAVLRASRAGRRAPPAHLAPRRAPRIRRNHGALLLTATALVLFGLAPALLLQRLNAATPAQSQTVYRRWCSAVLTPLLRPRMAPELPPEGCEAPMLTLRARGEGREPALPETPAPAPEPRPDPTTDPAQPPALPASPGPVQADPAQPPATDLDHAPQPTGADPDRAVDPRQPPPADPDLPPPAPAGPPPPPPEGAP